jgi:hypothetical protein
MPDEAARAAITKAVRDPNPMVQRAAQNALNRKAA